MQKLFHNVLAFFTHRCSNQCSTIPKKELKRSARVMAFCYLLLPAVTESLVMKKKQHLWLISKTERYMPLACNNECFSILCHVLNVTTYTCRNQLTSNLLIKGTSQCTSPSECQHDSCIPSTAFITASHPFTLHGSWALPSWKLF